MARDPTLTQERIASQTQRSERHVGRVLDDLVAAGYISKEGRANRRLYAVHFAAPLVEPNGPTVGDLVALFDALD